MNSKLQKITSQMVLDGYCKHDFTNALIDSAHLKDYLDSVSFLSCADVATLSTQDMQDIIDNLMSLGLN